MDAIEFHQRLEDATLDLGVLIESRFQYLESQLETEKKRNDASVAERQAAHKAKTKAENDELRALANLDEALALLNSLVVWADNWLSDEAKEQGARTVINDSKELLKRLK